jgi:hypothetical protein
MREKILVNTTRKVVGGCKGKGVVQGTIPTIFEYGDQQGKQFSKSGICQNLSEPDLKN